MAPYRRARKWMVGAMAAAVVTGFLTVPQPATAAPAEDPAADVDVSVTFTEAEWEQLLEEGRKRQAGQLREPAARPQVAQRASQPAATSKPLGVVEAEREARQNAVEQFKADAKLRIAPDAD